jgi:hypothetical protein
VRAVLLAFLILASWPVWAEPLSRIVVRDGHFETAGGERFVPQGVNWVILSPGDIRTSRNISFNPDYYGPHREEIHAALRQIAGAGFNLVRIRLDAKAFDTGSYLDDVIDFVGYAAEQGLYTEPTGQWLPPAYYRSVSRMGYTDGTSGINQLLLSSELTQAYGRYIADLLRGVRDHGLLSAIFCVDLWSELAFDSDELPFSRDGGHFTPDWGGSYDMADSSARQALADDATVRWIDGVLTEARAVAPKTLFTSSAFAPAEVYRSYYGGVRLRDAKWGDPRQPFRFTAIERSGVDFLQVHLNPHAPPVSIENDLAAIEFGRLVRAKPIFLGETAAAKEELPTADAVVLGVSSFVHQACAHGFAGWAYWTWNTDEQRDLWNLAEQDGLLARRLSPKFFDWCRQS